MTLLHGDSAGSCRVCSTKDFLALSSPGCVLRELLPALVWGDVHSQFQAAECSESCAPPSPLPSTMSQTASTAACAARLLSSDVLGWAPFPGLGYLVPLAVPGALKLATDVCGSSADAHHCSRQFLDPF